MCEINVTSHHFGTLFPHKSVCQLNLSKLLSHRREKDWRISNKEKQNKQTKKKKKFGVFEIERFDGRNKTNNEEIGLGPTTTYVRNQIINVCVLVFSQVLGG